MQTNKIHVYLSVLYFTNDSQENALKGGLREGGVNMSKSVIGNQVKRTT